MSDLSLVWIDIETGGLNGRLENGRLGMEYYPILELAVIITDSQLNEIGPALRLAIYQPQSEIDKCHPWALDTHEESGLLRECSEAALSLGEAEQVIIDHLASLGIEKYDRETKVGGILCGNSIMFDRSFMMAQMPMLHDYLHYRQIDVSALNLALRMFAPEIAEQGTEFKQYSHESLPDIRESIAELRVYRDFITRAIHV